MAAIDGVKAANKLLSFGAVRPGYCLYYVWQAYDAVGANTHLTAGTAYEAWTKSKGKHKGDRNPPAGVPVFFGKKASSAAGDVVISLGGGKVAVTEAPGKGAVVGITTIDARQKQIGRPYLGWTECIFDQPIKYDKPKPSTSGSAKSKLPWANGRTDKEIIKDEQEFLNNHRGEKLVEDGIRGDKTIDAIRRYESFLRKNHGYKGAIDGIWGQGVQDAHERYRSSMKAKPAAKPKKHNPFGIPSAMGLQKIAALNGYKGKIDDIWGDGSAGGFAQFLRDNYKYVGNDILGPHMWAAIARWLRARWGYKGNDQPGPVMRAALKKANDANYKEL